MIFNLITDSKIENVFISDRSEITLYHTFEKAVELDSPSYQTQRITSRKYWCEDIDSFIKDYFKEQLKKYSIVSSLNVNVVFDFVIKVNEEYVCLKGKKIILLDANISSFFYEDIKLQSNKYEFEIIMKSIGCLNYAFHHVLDKLKEYFKNDYKYYIPVIYNLIKEKDELYSPNVFADIINAKKYLEENRLYNISGVFELKRDDKGKYLQTDYTEFLTGRLAPSTQSLQTLSSDKRDILTAEKGCTLIEFDFKSFEFNIFLDILHFNKDTDPHLDILNHLGLDIERDLGKKINYSSIYGMSPERVVEDFETNHGVKIDLEKLKSYPLFSNKMNIDIDDHDIIYTYFNRPIKIEKRYAAFHNFISGTAADIFFKKFCYVVDLLKNKGLNKILIQNHDSILVQLEELTCTEYKEQISNILISPINIFTFQIETKEGKNWSELS